MERSKLKSTVEAIIFACGTPVEAERIAQALSMREGDIIAICEELRQEYEQAERGVRIVRMNNSYQMCTPERFADPIRTVLDLRRNTPLSQAAAEVLAVIAYNQPVTKAFIEQVRGVDCSGVVSGLISRQLIEEKGRLELPGKPLVYGTTDHFLRCFNISSLDELPPLPDEEDNTDSADDSTDDDNNNNGDNKNDGLDDSGSGADEDEDVSDGDIDSDKTEVSTDSHKNVENEEETSDSENSDSSEGSAEDEDEEENGRVIAEQVVIKTDEGSFSQGFGGMIVKNSRPKSEHKAHKKTYDGVVLEDGVRILNGKPRKKNGTAEKFGSFMKGVAKFVNSVDKTDFNECAVKLIDTVLKPAIKPAVEYIVKPAAKNSIKSVVKPAVVSTVLVTAAAVSLTATAALMTAAAKTLTTAAKLIFAALVIAAAASQRSQTMQSKL